MATASARPAEDDRLKARNTELGLGFRSDGRAAKYEVYARFLSPPFFHKGTLFPTIWFLIGGP